ncbi:MAG: hypothetical protein JNM88_00470 [Chitinophagaceae bacterium]|nr:hypothetical protein [Chitinophagaceae bacterium]
MSPVAMLFDINGFTQKAYDDILAELEKMGAWPSPPGLLSHVAFQKGESWFVLDVWASTEEFQAFINTCLFPVFGKLGLSADPPSVYPVHAYAKNGGPLVIIN